MVYSIRTLVTNWYPFLRSNEPEELHCRRRCLPKVSRNILHERRYIIQYQSPQDGSLKIVKLRSVPMGPLILVSQQDSDMSEAQFSTSNQVLIR